MSSANGLVVGEKNVTILAPHCVLFTREEIVGLPCEKTDIRSKSMLCRSCLTSSTNEVVVTGHFL